MSSEHNCASNIPEASSPVAQVEVAAHAGACFGVNRALLLVEKTLEHAAGPVYTLGPLIHNPEVICDLARQGVQVVEQVPNNRSATLVLRSHGVTPAVRQQALDRGLHVVDATCPYVKKAQRAAERLSREGYTVVVVGDGGHPEVEGILAHAPGAIAVASPEEARELPLESPVGLVAQTTQSEAVYNAVLDALVARGLEVSVAHTICVATRERQEAAQRLAQTSDLMVVIGGKNSANTTRLAALCQAVCPTIHIEGAQELSAQAIGGAERIGVSAGASTPQSHLEHVVATLKAISGPSDAPGA